MNFLPRLFLAALLPLAGCATAPVRPIPHSPVEERPEPLPDGVKPLTMEQEEDTAG